MQEVILDPDLPIVDPHHHLWDRPPALLRLMPPGEHGFMEIIRNIPRYLVNLIATLRSDARFVWRSARETPRQHTLVRADTEYGVHVVLCIDSPTDRSVS